MSLRSRIARVARVLATRPPFDPRRALSADALDAAGTVLERLGAEPPEPVDPELASWFDEVIRPRLLSWFLYEVRQRDWADGKRAEWREAQYRRTQARMGYFSVDSPVFAGNARRAAMRLAGIAVEDEVAT